MLGFLKKLFGGKDIDYAGLLAQGALIVDVRTTGEFSSGHIRGSVNIPLDKLRSQLQKIPKNKPVIVCCASGMRSASAKSVLKSNGYNEVYNGGGWMSLKRYTR
jgi:rhodanese-related sulfurtransferase